MAKRVKYHLLVDSETFRFEAYLSKTKLNQVLRQIKKVLDLERKAGQKNKTKISINK